MGARAPTSRSAASVVKANSVADARPAPARSSTPSVARRSSAERLGREGARGGASWWTGGAVPEEARAGGSEMPELGSGTRDYAAADAAGSCHQTCSKERTKQPASHDRGRACGDLAVLEEERLEL